jgi:ABC-type transport system involved in multi-copper enzyme maturation permease subunit
MSSSIPSLTSWLDKTRARFGSVQPRLDRLLSLALAVSAIALVWFYDRLPLAWQTLGWGLVLVGLAVLLRRTGQQFFGPVFFYDLVRTARRGKQIGHRVLYAVLLVGIILLVLWSWFPATHLNPQRLWDGVPISLREKAQFAGTFFNTFMLVQFLVVVVVTPAYTATAIAEEKEKRTLEFLLATDLSDREIVLGMMAARLANLILLVLTGLPILSLFEFLGGVDPNLVVAGFVTTGMTVLSLGSMSILISVLARTALSALIQTYLWVLLYLFCFGFCSYPVIAAAYNYMAATTPGTGGIAPMHIYVSALLIFSGVHAFIAVVCCRSAIGQLRIQALGTIGRPRMLPPTEFRHRPQRLPERPANDAPAPRKRKATVTDGWGPYPAFPIADSSEESPLMQAALRPRPLPRVGDDALLWKELYTEQYFGMPGKDATGPILMVMALIICTMALMGVTASAQSGAGFHQMINALVRGLGTPGICFLGFAVALSAARRVSRERQRQTLDSLLTIPPEREEILFAKWLGSVLSVRGLWWAPVGLWGLGVVTGGLHLAALPLMLAALVVYLAFMASLGLWFSTLYGTTMRATLFTTLAALLILIGPGFMVSMTGSNPPPIRAARLAVNWPGMFAEYGLNPPAALWVLAFDAEDFAKDELLALVKIICAIAGLYCYLALAALLWWLSCGHLRARKGPAPRRVAPAPVSSVVSPN